MDALYLAVVSVSTVGYGDIHISDRLRALFAPFLVFAVFSTAYALRDLAAIPIEVSYSRSLEPPSILKRHHHNPKRHHHNLSAQPDGGFSTDGAAAA